MYSYKKLVVIFLNSLSEHHPLRRNSASLMNITQKQSRAAPTNKESLSRLRHVPDSHCKQVQRLTDRAPMLLNFAGAQGPISTYPQWMSKDVPRKNEATKEPSFQDQKKTTLSSIVRKKSPPHIAPTFGGCPLSFPSTLCTGWLVGRQRGGRVTAKQGIDVYLDGFSPQNLRWRSAGGGI